MNYLICYSYTNYKAQLKNNESICPHIWSIIYFYVLNVEGKG